MQNKEQIRAGINWKKLDENITVGHFLSSNTTPGYNPSQLYVKKIEALEKNSKNAITLFLLHDIGQHHGRFDSLIEWIKQRNSNVTFVSMDFVGHGLSSGTRGHFEQFDYLVNDFHYLLEQFTKKVDQQEKWFVLGHGMGGLVALDLLNRFQDSVENKIDGLVLSNFILKFSSVLLKAEEASLLEKTGIKKLLYRSRPLRIFKGNEVLTCPEAQLNFEQDPLVIHRPTLRSVKEIQKRMANVYQDSYFLSKPLMLLKSESGANLLSNGMDYFSRGIKKELLTEKKYSHMKHDLYNESEKENVFLDILHWMNTNES